MVAEGLIVSSEITGFISFFLTALTWLGVYISLFTTARSAPKTLPLILGNLRQEILSERSLMRYRIKEGDQYHVWPGRQFHRIGKQQSHARLAHDTLKVMWKEFRDIERMFTVGNVGDAEDGNGAYGTKKTSDEGSADEPSDVNGEKGGRTRKTRRLSRRNSTIKSRMGMCEAGLSIDRRTYYNTDLWHRFKWWYVQSDLSSLSDRLQKLQIRRMERDMFETDELVKRGLQILGGLSGDDVWYPAAKGRAPSSAGRKRPRRRSSYATSVGSRAGKRRGSSTGSDVRGGVRDVYEREVVRVRDHSPSEESPRSRAGRPRTSRARASSSVPTEYEIVSPGRVYIATKDDGRSRRSVHEHDTDRNWHDRPRSYSRERDRR